MNEGRKEGRKEGMGGRTNGHVADEQTGSDTCGQEPFIGCDIKSGLVRELHTSLIIHVQCRKNEITFWPGNLYKKQLHTERLSLWLNERRGTGRFARARSRSPFPPVRPFPRRVFKPDCCAFLAMIG